jgi:Ca2+-binding RTX toxin-like protein
MELIARSALDLTEPLGVYNASLYKGPSSLQFIQTTEKGIDLVLPFGPDSSKKKLAQRITGNIKFNTTGIFWEESQITSITEYDLESPSRRPTARWEASQFILKGRDILEFRSAYESWYPTPDNWEKYNAALKKTKALIEKKLFSGNDTIIGSAEIDTLIGGDGNDAITGKGSGDFLWGSKGADSFIYLSTADSNPAINAIDTINDFNGKDGDTINLKAIKIAGKKKMTYIGETTFNSAPGEVRFSAGMLTVDTDGDSIANMAINLPNITTLDERNLIL